jgi:hypothetical protein
VPRNSIPHQALAPKPSPADPAIAEAAKVLGRCTTEHVLDHLGLPVTRANEMAVARQLRHLGFTRDRIMIRGVRTYVFTPPAD